MYITTKVVNNTAKAISWIGSKLVISISGIMLLFIVWKLSIKESELKLSVELFSTRDSSIFNFLVPAWFIWDLDEISLFFAINSSLKASEASNLLLNASNSISFTLTSLDSSLFFSSNSLIFFYPYPYHQNLLDYYH